MRKWLIFGAVLALVLTSIFVRVPVLFDFAGFWATGKLAIQNPHAVYSAEAQAQAQAGHIYLPFLHAPHELLLFAPLSFLPLAWAVTVWRIFCFGALILSCRLLEKLSDFQWKDLLLASISLFPVIYCFVAGQDDLLVLALIAASLYFAVQGRDALAGSLLALSLVKPQLTVIIAFALLVNRRWKLFAWFCGASAALASASMAVFGPRVFLDLLALIHRSQDPALQAAMQVHPWYYPTIRGLTYMSGLPDGYAVVLSAGMILFGVWLWYRETDLGVLYATAVLVGTLVAFNWHMYDLATLLLPMAILYNRSRLAKWASLSILASPVVIGLGVLGLFSLLSIPVMLMLWPSVHNCAMSYRATSRGAVGQYDHGAA